MRRIALAFCFVSLAACNSSSTPTQPVQIDPAKALYYAKVAGCVAQDLAVAAAPIIAAASDGKGNMILTATGASAGTLCQITVPAAVVAPPGVPTS